MKIFLALGCLSLLLISLLFWGILNKESHHSSSSLYSAPLLKPDYETFKIKSQNPGGSPILHQDKEIYNQLIKKEEKLETPDEDFSAFLTDPTSFLEEGTEILKDQPLPPPSLESLYDPETNFPSPKESTPQSWSDIFEELMEQGIEPAASVQNSQFYCVTLPPVQDKEHAHTEWRRLRSKNKLLLQNLPMTITRDEKLEGKVQFQIQIGAFKSESEAENICLVLQNQKIPCYITVIKGS
ncbi:MAG: SPOR domain-containing protein [Proteobacteria bacterium]|nr:SPOR domain-containing protein [Pseudomonadota bacterium]